MLSFFRDQIVWSIHRLQQVYFNMIEHVSPSIRHTFRVGMYTFVVYNGVKIIVMFVFFFKKKRNTYFRSVSERKYIILLREGI